MTIKTFVNDEDNRDETKKTNLQNEIRSSWLGWRDSNPRMPEPEPGALPLGDIPLASTRLYHL
jgi:hypothetical protein